MNSKLILLFASSIFLIIFISGCTTENSENSSYNGTWLNNYIPVHSVGSGDNDFWTFSPSEDGHTVNHLPWIVDSLEERCVFFVVHKTGCLSCKPQADRVIDLASEYEEFLEFYDLDITLGGSIEQRAYDAYVYDPDGSPGLIALTGVFTLIDNNGTIEFAWHSWELDVTSTEMESWIRDSIYYYNAR